MADVFLYVGRGRQKYITSFSIIDNVDLEVVNNFGIWRLDEKAGYAWIWYKKRSLRLHVFIARQMGLEWNPSTHEIDHKNRIKLDNRRENLRVATQSQSSVNAMRCNSLTKYKGVRQWHNGRWAARIRNGQGKQAHLGYFDTAEEAALAYNQAAILYFGEFAALNTIGDK